MFERFRKQPPQGGAMGRAGAPAENDAAPQAADAGAAAATMDRAPADRPEDNPNDRTLAIKVELHQRLLDILNLHALEQATPSSLRSEIAAIAREQLDADGVVLRPSTFDTLVTELIHEVVGLGPLEPLLQDDTVSDILVTTHRQVYVERFGVLERSATRFKDDKHLMRVIEKIVRSVGRRIDEGQPWVDARLADGSRVNALIPPCAVDGPLLSIRKFSKKPLSIERLLELETMTPEVAEYLRAVVGSRLNVLISGGTGSGKTTTLNVLSRFIGERERIVTIEDTAELQLQQPHVARMESRPPNVEGAGEVTLRDLLRNALRMRPDRIIVGEVRGVEVLDMLQAMNTGHEGSMTTIHANAPRDAFMRIENMVGMAGVDIPMRAMRSQIAASIDVIIQVQRLTDGRRRVTAINEVSGAVEGDAVAMQEMFRFERGGIGADGRVLGRLTAAGQRSLFADRFLDWGFGDVVEKLTSSAMVR